MGAVERGRRLVVSHGRRERGVDGVVLLLLVGQQLRQRKASSASSSTIVSVGVIVPRPSAVVRRRAVLPASCWWAATSSACVAVHPGTEMGCATPPRRARSALRMTVTSIASWSSAPTMTGRTEAAAIIATSDRPMPTNTLWSAMVRARRAIWTASAEPVEPVHRDHDVRGLRCGGGTPGTHRHAHVRGASAGASLMPSPTITTVRRCACSPRGPRPPSQPAGGRPGPRRGRWRRPPSPRPPHDRR